MMDNRTQPFISVIIPVFNMAEGIVRCLRSVTCQMTEDIEIIVVDDGSTDGTAGVAREFAAGNPGIRYFHKPNGGVSSARNIGIAEAKGEYLMFIDADDEIEEDYLRNIADNAKSSKADILLWGIKQSFEDGHIEEWKPDLEGVYDRKAFLTAFPREQYRHHKGLYGFASNKLLKKSVIDRYNLRFDETMILMEDYDFFLRSYASCESFCCFHETGYLYKIYGSNGGSGRYSDSMYQQLIGFHTKCVDLLKSAGAYNDENKRILEDAIGGLSLATFLEMRRASYSKVKTCMDFLWDNPYCIPAVKRKETSKKSLKRFILNRNVPMTFLFVKSWRLYLSMKLRGK